jgi:fatty acid desaturase
MTRYSTPGKAYLSSAEIRPLAARSDAMGLWLVAHCWGVIALALGVFTLWPNPLTFVVAVALIGSRQLGLAILMHEAAHLALFKTRALNEIAGEWLCGRPIMAELPAYRHYHLTHHRFTQTDKDPDLSLSAKFPTSHASMKRKFIRDLTGRTGIKLFITQISTAIRLAGDHEAMGAAKSDAAQAFKSTDLVKSLVMFAGVTLLMGWVGDWWWGLAFWVLPYLTWFQFVLRVRNIAEHGATETSTDPFQNVRTTNANWFERTFVAPYWVNYHLEHHMIMHVPCWRLPAMQSALIAKGLGPRMNIAPTYRAAMMEAGWGSR